MYVPTITWARGRVHVHNEVFHLFRRVSMSLRASSTWPVCSTGSARTFSHTTRPRLPRRLPVILVSARRCGTSWTRRHRPPTATAPLAHSRKRKRRRRLPAQVTPTTRRARRASRQSCSWCDAGAAPCISSALGTCSLIAWPPPACAGVALHPTSSVRFCQV